MLHSLWVRKLFCFLPSGLGVALVLTLWLSLQHPAESSDYTVCPSGCDYTTIQAAVSGVEEGSTILVAAGVYRESVHITQSLTLEGAGSISTTISAYTLTEYSSVITVSKGITVALKGFQISDGTGSLVGDNGYGGGIYNQGTLLIENADISDHEIEVGNNHYGVSVYNQGSLKLVNTVIRFGWNNNGPSVYGGDIYNEGILEIENSTLGSNTTNSDYDAEGGSIYNRGVAYVRNTTIYGSDVESELTTAKGGGVYNQGSMNLENVLLIYNSVHNINAYGGAIYNEGDLMLNQVSMIGNVAATYHSLDEAEQAFGGGIYNGCTQDSCGALTINSSVLYDNIAAGANGQSGYSGSDIHGKAGMGGGIYNACRELLCASIIISNSLIAANTARGGNGGAASDPHAPPVYGSGGRGLGGGIFNEGGMITLFYSTIGDNNVIRGEAADELDGFGTGGGIYTVGTDSIFLKGTLISGNNASDDGPDCWGALTSQGYNLLQNITDCTINGNLIGNLLGIDPLLFLPGDYGDPTLTQPIAFNSPAVDAGDPLHCPPTDQRGVPRPVDGDQDGNPRCDIGAYERLPPTDFLYLPLLLRP